MVNSKFRRDLFNQIKYVNDVTSDRKLAEKLGITYGKLKGWIEGRNYIPLEIIPKDFIKNDIIIDVQNEGWGKSKAGKIGIRKLREKYPLSIRRQWSRKGGRSNIENLKTIRIKFKGIIKERARQSKFNKRKNEIERKIKVNEDFFQNSYPTLDLSKIQRSDDDIKNKILFPSILNKNLAEEIGLHIGDGTLSLNKNYFALRGYSNDELDYYKNHISKLYKTLYNLNIKIFVRGSVCGFEKSSKGIFEFKNKVLGIPYGEKSHTVDIPKIIKKSKNEKIIASCIRGILDSDGCIWFSKHGTYPRIEICSMSKKLINSLVLFLEKMGFEPTIQNNHTIVLHGALMLDLWLKKIGTNHSKHKLKISVWRRFGKCPPKLSYIQLKEMLEAPVM